MINACLIILHWHVWLKLYLLGVQTQKHLTINQIKQINTVLTIPLTLYNLRLIIGDHAHANAVCCHQPDIILRCGILYC